MPSENQDKAKAMILTDHYLTVEDLEGLGDRIRDGRRVTYPEDAVAGYTKSFEEEEERRRVFKRRVMVVVLLLALLALVRLLAGT